MNSGRQSLFAPIFVIGGLILAVWVFVDMARGAGSGSSEGHVDNISSVWRPSRFPWNSKDPRKIINDGKEYKERKIIEHPHRSDLSGHSVEKLKEIYYDTRSTKELKREVIWEFGKPERQSQMGDEFLRQILKESTEIQIKTFVMDTLMKRNDAFARELLEEAIKDPAEEVRMCAYLVLAFKPDDAGSIFDIFQRRFQEEEAVGAKKAVLVSMAIQRNEKARETFINVMQDEKQPMELRRASIVSLEEFPREEDIPMLEQLRATSNQKDETRELVDLLTRAILLIKTKGKDPIKIN